SSRRRHTRFSRDWSSDVCSSDLKMHFKDSEFTTEGFYLGGKGEYYISGNISTDKDGVLFSYPNTIPVDIHVVLDNLDFDAEATRSEERRVGKECRSVW